MKHSQRHRSLSSHAHDDYRTKDLVERMQHTFEFQLKGFKGNTRGDYIQEPFTTLAEMLERLPVSIAFDIELSKSLPACGKAFQSNLASSALEYPMLFEADDWKMDTYAIELNTFVDTILDKIYQLGANRAIIFSSFSPEICILLSVKQPSYPVLFLNDAGMFPTGDVRASNMQEAVHFAKRWNLAGIVLASEPLVMCPKLVEHTRASGLICASYGSLNNDPKNAKVKALPSPT